MREKIWLIFNAVARDNDILFALDLIVTMTGNIFNGRNSMVSRDCLSRTIEALRPSSSP